MTEEEVRNKHKIRIVERELEPCFQARCSCKYISAWQQYKGVVVQNGRIHVQKEVDKNA